MEQENVIIAEKTEISFITPRPVPRPSAYRIVPEFRF